MNDNKEENDISDLQRVLAGHRDSFASLVNRHQQAVANQMTRFSRKPGVCEELVQDVFVEAYLSLHTFKAKAPFSHWLARIATRVGYKYWKQRGERLNQQEFQDWYQSAREQMPDGSMDAKEASDLLHALLARLNDEERLILTLIYYDNMSIRQVSEETGWSEDAVKMRSSRARKKLKEIIERENILEELAWML